MSRILLGFFLSAVLCVSVFAQGNNNIVVTNAWVQAPDPDVKITETYMDIANNTPNPIVLVSVTTPWADSVEIHQQIAYKGFLKVVAVNGIPILPGSLLQLKPKAGYLELVNLAKTLHPGDQVPLTLGFQDGSIVSIEAPVRS